ncbi:MAG: hypothetical protein IT262_08030 [Saprospiraceae bacterium]|nr:hypothetical protein [Saprospiraceae bacterium]
MKKDILFSAAAFLLFITACKNDPAQVSSVSKTGLQLMTEANPAWQYENLRLYPIVADAALQAEQKNLSGLKTLAEGMKMQGFRITEQKQFGRTDERTYNLLTVQNKSQDTVYILSGDVVTGGKQDRVIAQDQIVMPGTVRNMDVFCVEKGRWSSNDTLATPSKQKLYAFSGYYSVASPTVRQAVQRTGSQQEVWAAVARVTEANGASSSTSTYAALETANEQKAKRDAYLRFFDGKLDAEPQVVGMVAVCGDQILGVDIFGNSDLFRREYSSLLHGYVTEAATAQCEKQADESTVRRAFGKVAALADPNAKPTDTAGKFAMGTNWVHLFSK